MFIYYNKVLHAHEFYTLLSLQYNKELYFLTDFILLTKKLLHYTTLQYQLHYNTVLTTVVY